MILLDTRIDTRGKCPFLPNAIYERPLALNAALVHIYMSLSFHISILFSKRQSAELKPLSYVKSLYSLLSNHKNHQIFFLISRGFTMVESKCEFAHVVKFKSIKKRCKIRDLFSKKKLQHNF